ncbi:hypothetical protein FOC4_g10013227 [Fusarium odoratissimum]|uniref:Uncharacterized protein n=1 Tax=Fusarium oxysporum f. sp. cubense (strain race 4) TaxID=2502994 RepID=N1RBW4_FUSC4|nr:hypothetical protein FOC4_g10013227 [Fusarium odoratissimum]
MHSGTKYIGGHSDMLCGVLSLCPAIEATESWSDKLRGERVFLGSVMASLEGWLGVWSVRTLELCMERQARSAGSLINRFPTSAKEPGPVGEVVAQVRHASLQPKTKGESSWLRKQWRALLDQSIDRCLLRVNVGVEHWEDLKANLLQAFEALCRESK